jgi:hypothetical protein
LLFRSEEEVNRWCRETAEEYGEVVSVARVWKLAQLWYGNRMNPDYRGRTTAEAEEIFNTLGLTSAFWKF